MPILSCSGGVIPHLFLLQEKLTPIEGVELCQVVGSRVCLEGKS